MIKLSLGWSSPYQIVQRSEYWPKWITDGMTQAPNSRPHNRWVKAIYASIDPTQSEAKRGEQDEKPSPAKLISPVGQTNASVVHRRWIRDTYIYINDRRTVSAIDSLNLDLIRAMSHSRILVALDFRHAITHAPSHIWITFQKLNGQCMAVAKKTIRWHISYMLLYWPASFHIHVSYSYQFLNRN